MRRREFVGLIGSAAAWPICARAQQSGPLRVIGILMLNEETDPEGEARVASFRQNLGSLGWDEGKNAHFDVRWYGGDLDRAKALAREIVDRSPDVIVANGTQGVAALQQLTKSIPIVFVVVTDPLGAGFVKSFSEPEANITGFSTFEPEIGGKWIEALLEIAPNTKRVAVLSDPVFSGFAHVVESINAAAPAFGIKIVPLHARNGVEIERELSPNLGDGKGQAAAA